ncbi:hypothetical protein [Nocardioides soli]|uniref:Putative DNA-binding protein (UPF0251 family) n=1 Tax=Nocardioides soli TaxID=1036020 RepID=A0A7W4Z0V1_9ACTN|nr:hypothetical protein [Nocardioides soli]MBB3041161.1 putative DNA-binding protein (UPF0251 family) [Nocardioides soli]
MTATVAETATLAWGYTMADVDRLARFTARIRNTSLVGFDERYETAWLAIIERLYDGPEMPTSEDLIQVGKGAIRDEVNALLHHRGINNYTYQDTPNSWKYWSVISAADEDFTGRLVERLALPQVLALLTPGEYEAIAALAANGTQAAAAAAVGIKPSAFTARIARARQRIIEAWFEHETPRKSTTKGNDIACSAGHPRATHSTKDSLGHWDCRTCRRRRDLAGYHRRKPLAKTSAAALD